MPSHGRVLLSLYERPRLPRAWVLAWRLGFVSLLAIVLLYPILATERRSPIASTSVGRTLDGTAFMTKAVLADQGTESRWSRTARRIDWMLTTLKGSPVSRQVNCSDALRMGEPVRDVHGNPAVVGWDYELATRRRRRARDEPCCGDVQQAYATADPSEAYEILERYGVRYVVVGPLERAYFPEGNAK